MKQNIIRLALLLSLSSAAIQANFFDEIDNLLDQVRKVPGHIQNRMGEITQGDGDVLDIIEDLKDNKIIIKASIPGYKKKDIAVSVKEDSEGRKTLWIKATSEDKKEEKAVKNEDGRYVHHQVAYWSNRSFSRSARIPSSAIAKKIVADYEDGILTVTVPLDTDQRESTIEVSID